MMTTHFFSDDSVFRGICAIDVNVVTYLTMERVTYFRTSDIGIYIDVQILIGRSACTVKPPKA